MTGYTNTFALGSTNSWAPAVSGQRWWHAQPVVSGWQGRSLTGSFVQPNQPMIPVANGMPPGTVGAPRQRYANSTLMPYSPAGTPTVQGPFVAGSNRRIYRSRGLNG